MNTRQTLFDDILYFLFFPIFVLILTYRIARLIVLEVLLSLTSMITRDSRKNP